MHPQEQERWEQFCRTGLVRDYLEYRGLADRRLADPAEEEIIDADRDQSGGPDGQEYGRI